MEFEELFNDKAVEYISTIACDNVLEIAEKRKDFKNGFLGKIRQ